MTERAKKISAFPALSGPTGNTFLVVAHTAANGVTNTYSLGLTTLFGNSAANVVMKEYTPSNSTISVAAGTCFYDNTYFYIATANNVLKRITLDSF
jgi:hypothetical protein